MTGLSWLLGELDRGGPESDLSWRAIEDHSHIYTVVGMNGGDDRGRDFLVIPNFMVQAIIMNDLSDCGNSHFGLLLVMG